jgi:hypothetical protein
LDIELIMVVSSRRGEWWTARIFLVRNAVGDVPYSWPIRVRGAAREMPGNQGRRWGNTPENMTWTDIFGHFDGNR